MWVAVRLACFRARAQRNDTRNRNRNRERREADYDYEHEYDSYVESRNPELNQALRRHMPDVVAILGPGLKTR